VGGTYKSDHVLLETIYVLRQGHTYSVQVVYEETWPGGWTGSVTSNVVKIHA
jgi:hypothetical protein